MQGSAFSVPCSGDGAELPRLLQMLLISQELLVPQVSQLMTLQTPDTPTCPTAPAPRLQPSPRLWGVLHDLHTNVYLFVCLLALMMVAQCKSLLTQHCALGAAPAPNLVPTTPSTGVRSFGQRVGKVALQVKQLLL